MKITLNWLKKQGACSECVDWFKAQTETDAAKVIEKLIAEKQLDWANWTIARVLNRKQRIQYAVYAAEQVIDIYDKQYPDDNRPRQAIEAAKVILINNTRANRDAAESAAKAAESAASATRGATWNVARSAASAARTAEKDNCTAERANWAAERAEWAAENVAGAAAENEMQVKILTYGLSLLA